ncbi:hypothetical protein CDAR_164151 [Caerostris darwini]|uniref:Transmembrane protein n=1 Tax=Caerostris darwini TaxID=1538125 RepID=A0AAV4X7R3_9ARAC|nr:hypothetical protein CDAR_164151 [Caerostris darwini]
MKRKETVGPCHHRVNHTLRHGLTWYGSRLVRALTVLAGNNFFTLFLAGFLGCCAVFSVPVCFDKNKRNRHASFDDGIRHQNVASNRICHLLPELFWNKSCFDFLEVARCFRN